MLIKIMIISGPDGIHPRILYELWYELESANFCFRVRALGSHQ